MLEDFFAIIAASYTDAELNALIVWADTMESLHAGFNSDYVCWRDRVR